MVKQAFFWQQSINPLKGLKRVACRRQQQHQHQKRATLPA
jgi:hypothetical protein